jgi:hypothetical protein
MKENVIVIMVRSTLDDVNLLNECLRSLELNLGPTLADSDFVFFVEKDFGKLRESVVLPYNFKNSCSFVEIDLSIPQFTPNESEIPAYFPHPTHSNGPIDFGHPGFSIEYRSMCRFFSGVFFMHQSLSCYRNYIRLDTDSKFINGSNFSLFDWLQSESLIYGYIESAVQNDNPGVVHGLREAVKSYCNWPKRFWVPRGVGTRMYYTNFEIGSLDFFRSETWQKFFNHLDSLGGFYMNRWGDAPVRYAGLWVVGHKNRVRKIPPGFTYFHGDYFKS